MLHRHFPHAVALTVATTAVLLLTGCAGPALRVGSVEPSSGSATPTPVAPELTVTSPARWNQPLHVSVTTGTLTSVVVTDRDSKAELAGSLEPGGTSWISDALPHSGSSYLIAAVATTGGAPTSLRAGVKVTVQPDSAKIRFGIVPGTGAVVGVNAPVVIRFNHSVTNRADVESALHVASSVPVVGAWHWINSSEVHFRPKAAWPAHTKVRVTATLDGLRASDTRYATRDVTVNFTVGDSHLTTVNDTTHIFTLTVNGKSKYAWPTSLGRPEFVTRSGNYIVLEKLPLREMTSCAIKITCDKKSKDYYDLKVLWATRLSWSGTFIHAAPWSVAKQGFTDGSHGCIHLTTDRAKTYFDLAQYGDLITVVGTGRPIDDLVAHGDPGTTDWNTTWTSWVAGSATGSSLTTDALTA